MYDSPLVSVIIPYYNQSEYILECIESVVSQSYQNVEIIIVDDGSRDPISNINSNLLTFSIVKILTIENNGLPFARNHGIINSKGKYILPLDADDKIASNYIEQAVSILEKDYDTCLVYGAARYFGELNSTWSLEKYSFDKMIFYNQIYASAIFRRADFDLTNGYDISMNLGWEDWDFWLSILTIKSKVHFIEDVCFFYRVRNDSMSKKMSDDFKIKLRRYIYQKHSNLYNHLFTDPLSLYHEFSFYRNQYDLNIFRRIMTKLKSYFILSNGN
jgi:glycosyltransferase involved in cell wall biosynthesis